MKSYFKLTEIGFDTSIESADSLIEIAQDHCSSYTDDRVKLLPIDTLDKAIRYFTNYGFEVTELKAKEDVCPICGSNDLKYGVSEVEFPTGAYIPCTCNNCNAVFDEWYDLTFSGHYNIYHDFAGASHIEELH